eukprot:TRINITY_DN10120_c1_g1_i1.p1 TRINITY_DN10120_c1_g1~~TRINITY_DN10120_c1_g1_i1.p1  ORF type:complete len:102 (+),score=6.79 TRINITY_DN10120_c1_g1_i1:142-447(+)
MLYYTLQTIYTIILTYFGKAKAKCTEALTISGIVWPWTMDWNFHMNNAYYLYLADFGRIDWYVRNGLGKHHGKFGLVVGYIQGRYRRSLTLFERYKLEVGT